MTPHDRVRHRLDCIDQRLHAPTPVRFIIVSVDTLVHPDGTNEIEFSARGFVHHERIDLIYANGQYTIRYAFVYDPILRGVVHRTASATTLTVISVLRSCIMEMFADGEP